MDKVIGAQELQQRKQKYRVLFLIAGIVALIFSMIIALRSGVMSISYEEIYKVLINEHVSDNIYRIVYYVRLPRIVLSMLVGCNLALAGCILQGVLKNPLADPGIIGVSSGAGLVAMLVMIIFPEVVNLVPPLAFAGAMIATGILFILAWEKGIQPLRLILAGVAVNAFFAGGMTCLMVFFSDKLQGTVDFLAGGFASASWEQVKMILPYSIVSICLACYTPKYLNALQLGDEVAKSLGLRVDYLRVVLVSLAALLAALAVSVAGLLTFVGLIIPHMVRLVVGSNYHYILPFSALFGALLMVVADTVARCAFAPIEVPVGVFMSFVGAPFFLYLLKRGLRSR